MSFCQCPSDGQMELTQERKLLLALMSDNKHWINSGGTHVGEQSVG